MKLRELLQIFRLAVESDRGVVTNQNSLFPVWGADSSDRDYLENLPQEWDWSTSSAR